MTGSPLDEAAVRAHETYLYRLAVRSSRDTSVAWDIVQATFLAVVEHPKGYDPARGPLRGYLTGVLLRKVADHFRHARRDRGLDDFTEDDAAMTERVSHDPSRCMHPADRKSALRVVDAALAALPDAQRLAVIACDVEQIDRAEAARTLGVTEGNLRVLLHRGRHHLRKALEDAGLR